MNANGRRFLAVLAVMAVAIVAFAIVDNNATDGAEDTISIHGEITEDQPYTTPGTKVVVDKDLSIKNGATLLIGAGVEFYIPAGVTLTVNGTQTDPAVDDRCLAALVIDTNASVSVDGNITVGEKGLIVYDESEAIVEKSPKPAHIIGIDGDFEAPNENFVPLMYVTGNIVIDAGKALLNSTKDDDGTRVLIFAEGASLDVRSTDASLACICGDVLLENGAKTSVSGKICDSQGKDGEFNIFSFADANAMFVIEYTTAEEQIESVGYVRDVWSFNDDTVVYISEISIKGNSEKYKDLNVAGLSELCVVASVNKYDAWTVVENEDKSLVQKMKVLESNLVMSGTLRGGDVIETSSADYQLIPYWSTNSDCEEMNDEFFYAGSAVTIVADFTAVPEPVQGMSAMEIVLIVLVVIFAIAIIFLALKLMKQTSS